MTFRFRSFFNFLFLALLIYKALAHYSVGNLPWIFYNSDNAFAYLYQNLIIQHGHISDWTYAATNNFFPDICLFFLITVLVHNFKITLLLISIIQILAFYYLCLGIAKLLLGKEKLGLVRYFLFYGLFLLAAGSFEYKEILESALVNWLHFGMVLTCLAAFLFVLRIIQYQSKWDYFFLSILCLLSTFSDVLFITQFSTPAFLTLLFFATLFPLQRKLCTTIAINILMSTLIAYVVYRHNLFGLIHINYNGIHVQRGHALIHGMTKLQWVLSEFSKSNATLLLLWLSFVIFSISYARKLRVSTFPLNINLCIIFALMASIVGFFSLILLDNDLLVHGYFGMRHYQLFILFSVFIAIPVSLSLQEPFFVLFKKYEYLLLFVLVCCTALLNPYTSTKNLIQFYPNSVACLDRYADQYHLSNGIANYWESRSYTLLSKNHLHVVAVDKNLKPYLNIATSRDYLDKDFNFLIVQAPGTLTPSYGPGGPNDVTLNKEQIAQRLGKPTKVLSCPSPLGDGQETLYVYPPGVISQYWNL